MIHLIGKGDFRHHKKSENSILSRQQFDAGVTSRYQILHIYSLLCYICHELSVIASPSVKASDDHSSFVKKRKHRKLVQYSESQMVES
jgi:hypothetical protein